MPTWLHPAPAAAATPARGVVMIGEETTSGSKPPAPAPTTIRLVNFMSEDQLDEVKRTRGERAGDSTAQRDKPLFQANKEKKGASSTSGSSTVSSPPALIS
uniref:Uncharacterized protein n=1 Tax=Oryza punctata TaxID=4537 RepID=A0A0E0JJF0_ORYPU